MKHLIYNILLKLGYCMKCKNTGTVRWEDMLGKQSYECDKNHEDTIWNWLKEKIMHPYRRIKWFFQKLFRGYSQCDLWNLDIHLAEIILPRLIAFKKMKRMGVPGALCSEPQTDEEFQESQINWEEIIDKMILAFKLIKNDSFDSIEEMKDNTKKIEEGLQLFSQYFYGLWD